MSTIELVAAMKTACLIGGIYHAFKFNRHVGWAALLFSAGFTLKVVVS